MASSERFSKELKALLIDFLLLPPSIRQPFSFQILLHPCPPGDLPLIQRTQEKPSASLSISAPQPLCPTPTRPGLRFNYRMAGRGGCRYGLLGPSPLSENAQPLTPTCVAFTSAAFAPPKSRHSAWESVAIRTPLLVPLTTINAWGLTMDASTCYGTLVPA